jgi:hypothetical protein
MLNLDIGLSEWSFPLPGHFALLGESALYPSTWLGPRASLDTLERRKVSYVSLESSHDSPDV